MCPCFCCVLFTITEQQLEVSSFIIICFLLYLDYLNARSINISHRSNVIDKFEEITSIILNENFNIFALSETWLNASRYSRFPSSKSIGQIRW